MAQKRPPAKKVPAEPRFRHGTDVTLRLIRSYARKIAERFRPEKIILFGSHAYGVPHADSDVDLLVVMPARNEIDQSCRILEALMPPFALDLLVWTPKRLAWHLKEGDSFIGEVVKKGKVLHEGAHQDLAAKSGRRSAHGSAGSRQLQAAS